MQFTVNGRRTEASVRPGASLLELLRTECGLRSMKDGCAPEGSCGACTVMVDGRAVVSCATPASRVEGREVRSVEGLSQACTLRVGERIRAQLGHPSAATARRGS